MNKTDKILVIFYVILGISFVTGVIYFDLEYRKQYPDVMNSTKIFNIFSPVESITIHKTVDADLETLFSTISNPETYPYVLPKNVKSSQILSDNGNEKTVKTLLSEQGITTEITSKHVENPYESYVIEVTEGDAKGTLVTLKFKELDEKTEITGRIDFELTGILSPFVFLPEQNLQHAFNTVIDSFVVYAQSLNDPTKKTVDNMYREILNRPADIEGLNYYSNLLDANQLTESQLREQLMNSEERKLLEFRDKMKPVEQLSNNTKTVIDELYQEILFRPADNAGLKYYGNMLEFGNMSIGEIRQELLSSEEHADIQVFFGKNNSATIP